MAPFSDKLRADVEHWYCGIHNIVNDTKKPSNLLLVYFMKHLLLASFLLSTTVIAYAGQTNTPGECLEMYRTYLMDQNSRELQSKDVPLDYTNSCLPDSASRENPQYHKLMQLMEDDKQIVALEARLLERGFINAM